jgi:hypothetical protein
MGNPLDTRGISGANDADERASVVEVSPEKHPIDHPSNRLLDRVPNRSDWIAFQDGCVQILCGSFSQATTVHRINADELWSDQFALNALEQIPIMLTHSLHV